MRGKADTVFALPAPLRQAVVTRLAEAQGANWAGTTLGLMVRKGAQWENASS